MRSAGAAKRSCRAARSCEEETHDVVTADDVDAERDLLYGLVGREDALDAAGQDHVGRLVKALELALWTKRGSSPSSAVLTREQTPRRSCSHRSAKEWVLTTMTRPSCVMTRTCSGWGRGEGRVRGCNGAKEGLAVPDASAHCARVSEGCCTLARYAGGLCREQGQRASGGERVSHAGSRGQAPASAEWQAQRPRERTHCRRRP